MSNAQLLISVGIPSILVILSWLHNDSRLNRLEAGQDNLSRRMDEVVKNFHSDMMSFQASMLEAVYTLCERVAVIESKRP